VDDFDNRQHTKLGGFLFANIQRLKLTEGAVVKFNANTRELVSHILRTPSVQNCYDAVGSLAASRYVARAGRTDQEARAASSEGKRIRRFGVSNGRTAKMVLTLQAGGDL
jgi:hypothetical protein